MPTFSPTSPPPGTTPGKLVTQGKEPAKWVTASLRKRQHTCAPGPEQSTTPHPQTGGPGPSQGYQLPRSLTCPFPAPLLTARRASKRSPAGMPSRLLPPGLDQGSPALTVLPQLLPTHSPLLTRDRSARNSSVSRVSAEISIEKAGPCLWPFESQKGKETKRY